MNLDAIIEAILFWRGEPVSEKELCKLTEKSPEEVRAACESLSKRLQGGGLTLMAKDGEYALGTSTEASGLIEKLTKEELSRDIGKAGLETLTIVAYASPVTRREIDYIRGVNSSFILRNLSVRGLVERIETGKSSHYAYRPTFELLSYLGASRPEDLPDYSTVRDEMRKALSPNEPSPNNSSADGAPANKEAEEPVENTAEES